MQNKKNGVLIAVLVFLALIIRLFSSNSARVELYYSTGIYPYIAGFLRGILGWLPFSIGDILYAMIVGWLIFTLVQVVRAAIRKQLFSNGYITEIRKGFVKLLLIYILFNALWGINYNRKGIASQLGLVMDKYTVAELKTLNAELLQKVNASKLLVMQQPAVAMSSKEIFNRSKEAYKLLNKQYPFLNYEPPSIKTSMWGWLGNYVGFLGYYNPFTGEGQVNTTVPKFLQSFTSCHEIAHQLGYAKENEANFVGYLAAAASKDEILHYSVYLDLFLYANRNLFQTDSTTARKFSNELLPAVKADLKEWRKFNNRHKNPVEPMVRWMYGKYLENNEQPSGLLSYDEVTGFLIAYYKKYGKL